MRCNQALAPLQQRISLLTDGRRELASTLLQRCQRRSHLLEHAPLPFDEIGGSERLWIERGVSGAAGECAVQLGGAGAEGLHEREEAAVRVGRRMLPGAVLLEIALEVVDACSSSRRLRSGDMPAAGPASTASRRSPMYSRAPATGTQFGKCATSVRNRPISSSGFRPGRTRRYPLRKSRSPRVTAVLLPCVLRAAELELRHVRTRDLPERTRRHEPQFAVRGRELRPWPIVSTIARQKTASGNASVITPTLACWRTLATVADLQAAHAGFLRLFPREREREEVAEGLCADLDVELADEPRLVSTLPQSVVDQACALHRLALLREPAPPFDVTRKDILLELLAYLLRHADPPGHDPVAEEAHPAVEEHEHRKLFARDERFVPVGRFHVRGESKPVEAVCRQGEQVWQLADRREGDPAQHLDRHAARDSA